MIMSAMSAMHTALSLPEIVCHILSVHRRNTPVLRSCVVVNRVFYIEAARLLWETCRDGEIKQLSRISRQDPARAQIYARFIKYLTLERDVYRARRPEMVQRGDHWHSALAPLNFPILEKVIIWILPDISLNLNCLDVLLHYLGRGLKEFSIMVRTMPSDDFLQALAIRSPDLRILELGNHLQYEDGPGNAPSYGLSEAGVIQYLKDAHHLSRLRYTYFLIWTPGILEAIANHPNITSLELPAIPSTDWIAAIRHTLQFPNLTKLHLRTDYDIFNSLLPYIRNITELQLFFIQIPVVTEPLLLPSIATLEKLVLIDVVFPSGMHICADELITLAKRFPNLNKLYLSTTHFQDYILSDDITDSTIAEMASHLPQLERISLGLKPILLTYKAFMSLYSHCTRLKLCNLGLDFDFEEFLLQNPPISTHLRLICFTMPDDQHRYRDPVSLARRLRATIPNVYSLSVLSGSMDDIALVNAFHMEVQPRELFPEHRAMLPSLNILSSRSPSP